MHRLVQLAIGLVVLGIVLWPLERLFPSVAGKKILRKGIRVDLIYWFFTPTITAGFTFGITVLTAISINLQILGATSGLLTFWAIFVHSNVRWTFGPLRHVVATPAFHRWHHTSQSEGLDKNFGGLFLFWDRLFGTLYLPKGSQAQRIGLFGQEIPDSFFRQLAWPFRKNLKMQDSSATFSQ